MTEEKGNSNLIILGIAALAAMFFAYLIYSSNKNQNQQLQLPQTDNLKAYQLQEQIIELQKIQLKQAQNITELENNKCATEVTIPQPVTPQPTQQPVQQEEFIPGSDMLSAQNEVYMPQQKPHSLVNMSNVTRENEEIIANRYFGMV